ncbi:MAG: 1,4-dihydroxy-2-naphthoate octaprenyltransferase [Chitinophagaceae bacterium]|nr:1,4-dihydroxy-2-naphthoate octaprenyltransferase [Anaerolineae bacterium]
MTAAPPLPHYLENRPKLAAWYRASRPRVFTASYVPMGVAAAAALQNGVFELIPFLLATLGVMLLQTAANLINEYVDFRRGAEDLKQAGQSMVIKNNLLTPREVLIGAIASVIGGCLIGLYLLTQSGPLLWGIGIGGVLVAITYTAGPFPLAYNGLGEIAAGIFMGPMIVLGAYYVMAKTVYADLIWISIPVALMVAAILHANNIRDVDADRSVNKRTLVVLLGMRFARAEYAFLVIGTYVSLVILVLVGLIPPGALIAILTLPDATQLVKTIYTETNTAKLHQAQGLTARLHGRFGLFMVVGWLAWLVIQAIL